MSRTAAFKKRARKALVKLLAQHKVLCEALKDAIEDRDWQVPQQWNQANESDVTDVLIKIVQGEQPREEPSQEEGVFDAATLVNDIKNTCLQDAKIAQQDQSESKILDSTHYEQAIREMMGWVCVLGLDDKKLEQMEQTPDVKPSGSYLFLPNAQQSYSHIITEFFLALEGKRWARLQPTLTVTPSSDGLSELPLALTSRTILHVVAVDGGSPKVSFQRIATELYTSYNRDKSLPRLLLDPDNTEDKKRIEALNRQINIDSLLMDKPQCLVEVIAVNHDPILDDTLCALLHEHLSNLKVVPVQLTDTETDLDFLNALLTVLERFFSDDEELESLLGNYSQTQQHKVNPENIATAGVVGQEINSAEQPNNNKIPVYVSYTWRKEDDQSEDIVNAFDAALPKQHFIFKQDKQTLKPGQKISHFMCDEIGRGNYVLVVISEQSLKSHYCMQELLHLMEYNQKNEDRFLQKVIPIVVGKINISGSIEKMHYALYWKNEVSKIKKLLKDSDTEITAIGDDLCKDYIKMQSFQSNIYKILTWLSDIVMPRGLDGVEAAIDILIKRAGVSV